MYLVCKVQYCTANTNQALPISRASYRVYSMLAVVKPTEANFPVSKNQPRRTSWTVLLGLSPSRKMSDGGASLSNPGRSPSPASSPSPSTENRRFPGLSLKSRFGKGEGKKKNGGRKVSRSSEEPRLQRWVSVASDKRGAPPRYNIYIYIYILRWLCRGSSNGFLPVPPQG